MVQVKEDDEEKIRQLKQSPPEFKFAKDFREKYDLGVQIGKGGFGKVYEVTQRTTGKTYACKEIVKILDISDLRYQTLLQHFDNIKKEVQVMKLLRGLLNVAHLINAYEDENKVYLVMELCTGGPIFDRFYSTGSEGTVASIIRAVLRTLLQCHTKYILHRDIKASNFLFLNSKESSPVKAIDFGLAAFYDPNSLPRTDLGLDGTPWFQAPEVLNGQYYPKSDIWSCGVLCYQMLSGNLPFDDRKNPNRPSVSVIWRSILVDKPKLEGSTWKNVSEEAKDFLRLLLNKEQDKRPSALEALQHPWLSSGEQVRNKGNKIDVDALTRLQRYSQRSPLKQGLLDLIAQELLNYYAQKLWDESTHGAGNFKDNGLRSQTVHSAGLYWSRQAQNSRKILNIEGNESGPPLEFLGQVSQNIFRRSSVKLKSDVDRFGSFRHAANLDLGSKHGETKYQKYLEENKKNPDKKSESKSVQRSDQKPEQKSDLRYDQQSVQNHDEQIDLEDKQKNDQKLAQKQDKTLAENKGEDLSHLQLEVSKNNQDLGDEEDIQKSEDEEHAIKLMDLKQKMKVGQTKDLQKKSQKHSYWHSPKNLQRDSYKDAEKHQQKDQVKEKLDRQSCEVLRKRLSSENFNQPTKDAILQGRISIDHMESMINYQNQINSTHYLPRASLYAEADLLPDRQQQTSYTSQKSQNSSSNHQQDREHKTKDLDFQAPSKHQPPSRSQRGGRLSFDEFKYKSKDVSEDDSKGFFGMILSLKDKSWMSDTVGGLWRHNKSRGREGQESGLDQAKIQDSEQVRNGSSFQQYLKDHRMDVQEESNNLKMASLNDHGRSQLNQILEDQAKDDIHSHAHAHAHTPTTTHPQGDTNSFLNSSVKANRPKSFQGSVPNLLQLNSNILKSKFNQDLDCSKDPDEMKQQKDFLNKQLVGMAVIYQGTKLSREQVKEIFRDLKIVRDNRVIDPKVMGASLRERGFQINDDEVLQLYGRSNGFNQTQKDSQQQEQDDESQLVTNISLDQFISSQVDWPKFKDQFYQDWIKIVERTFNGIDKDSSGKIDKENFSKFIKQRLPQANVEPYIDQFMLENAANEYGLDLKGFMQLMEDAINSPDENINLYDKRYSDFQEDDKGSHMGVDQSNNK